MQPHTLALALVTLIVTAAARDKALAGDQRPVSVTIGCIEYRNWEANLVRNNPNLRHYHWNPIYANVQAVHMVGPGNPPPMEGTSGPKKHGGPPDSPRNLVVKTNKQHPLFYKRPANPHFVYHPNFYKRPVHLAPQHNTSTSIAYKYVAPGTDLNGKLKSHNPSHVTARDLDVARQRLLGTLKPKPVPLIAHGKKLNLKGRKAVHGILAHKEVSGQLTHKDVQGQLVAQAVSRTSTGDTARMMDDSGAYTYYAYPIAGSDASNNNLSRSNVNGRVSHQHVQTRNY